MKKGLPKSYISFTQISNYIACPRYYYIKYHLKKAQPESFAMRFGAMQHEVVHAINRAIKETKENLSFDDVQHFYDDIFKQYHFDAEAYSRGKENMRAYALKTVAEKAIIFECEYKFRHELPNGIIIEGRIDRIDIPAIDTIEIIDFKSGSLIPSVDELKRDPQLRIYAFFAANLVPDVKTIKVSRQSLQCEVLKDGTVSGGYKKSATLDRIQLDDTGEYLQMIGDKMAAEKEWKPNPEIDGTCRYCPDRCKDYFEIARQKVADIDPDNIAAVGSQFIATKNQMAIITAQEKALKKLLKAHFDANLTAELEIGDKVIYASREHKDPETIAREGYDYTKISIGKRIKSGMAIDMLNKAIGKARRNGTIKGKVRK